MPMTRTAALGDVIVPSPSCPFSFEPQHQTLPSLNVAQLMAVPALIEVAITGVAGAPALAMPPVAIPAAPGAPPRAFTPPVDVAGAPPIVAGAPPLARAPPRAAALRSGLSSAERPPQAVATSDAQLNHRFHPRM